jgi:hypothetical protein
MDESIEAIYIEWPVSVYNKEGNLVRVVPKEEEDTLWDDLPQGPKDPTGWRVTDAKGMHLCLGDDFGLDEQGRFIYAPEYDDDPGTHLDDYYEESFYKLRAGLDAIFDLRADDDVDEILKRIRHVMAKLGQK